MAESPSWSNRVETLATAGGPILLIVAIASLVLLSGDNGLTRIATLGLVHLVLVVGLYIFVGNSGVLSFGQMSFMAVGGYLAGLLTIPLSVRGVVLPQLPEPLATILLPSALAVLAGAVLAAAVGFLVAIPLMRLSGIAAGIASLAVLHVTFVVAGNWDAVTGGAASMPAVPRATGLLAALLWAVGAILVAWLFQISAAGMRMRAGREDELAAAAIGIDTVRHRILSFTLSAFVVGAGGGLYVQFLGIGSPDTFYLGITFLTLAMLVIGGMNSLWGAVVGSVTITVLGLALLRLEAATGILNLREIGLALLMLAILILRPRGLTNGREFTVTRPEGWISRLVSKKTQIAKKRVPK